ncbi:MAG: hypothetical protein ABR601_05080 [Parasphingopyxis sp.]|nr:hypothetical protein [Sphingomonadales bacterium]
MRAAVLLIAPVLALATAACQPEAEPEPEVEAELPSAVPEPGWTADGGDLLLHDEAGAQLLRLGCTAGPPAELVARFGAFDPIGSEERLNLGLGEEIVTMVAQVVGAEGPGLIASARYDAAIGRSLAQAGSISAFYGNQQLGPVGPPDAAQTRALLAGCGG